LCHGIDLKIPGISKLNDIKKDDTVALMSLKDELIALFFFQLSQMAIFP